MVLPAIYIISMPRHMNKRQLLVLLFILLLMFINITATTMLIPSYTYLAGIFNRSITYLYVVDGAFTLMAAIFSIVWGYFADKLNKKIIILFGSIVSAIGFLVTYFSQDFIGLLIARAITGGGMGMVFPVGFSMIADLVPSKERNGWFAFLSIFSSLASGLGNSIAAFTQYGWQVPFLILSLVSIIPIILLGIVNPPRIGDQDSELTQLKNVNDAAYVFHISRKDIPILLKKRTNRALIFTSFFQIIPGTVIVYALILTFSHPQLGFFRNLPIDIRSQISTIISGLVGVGYIIGNAFVSNISDKAFAKRKRGRAKITFIAVSLAIPLLLLMTMQLTVLSPEFVQAQNYPSIIESNQKLMLVIKTILAIFSSYPQYIFFLLCALFGSYLIAAPSTGKNAVMIDVNLPEHRGTATSLIQNGENVGKTIVLFLVPQIMVWINNYQLLLFISILFYIPAVFCWWGVYHWVEKDLQEKETVFHERAQESLLDYYTQMENGIDQGIFLMETTKRLMLQNPKKAEKSLESAINLFKAIYTMAETRKSAEIADRTLGLLNHALYLKSDFLMVSKKPKISQLEHLAKKIDQIWDKSDLGTLQAMAEEAYLKVYEARIKCAFNPIETMQGLNEAREKYLFVIQACEERIAESEIKHQNTIENQRIQQTTRIMEQAKKWCTNLLQIQQYLENLLQHLETAGITKDQLISMINLHEEYQVELSIVLSESFSSKLGNTIRKIIKAIDKTFDKFDKY